VLTPKLNNITVLITIAIFSVVTTTVGSLYKSIAL